MPEAAHKKTRTSIDEALGGGRRHLRTHPKLSLLGPTGARLWADALDSSPGFAGSIDFIHKCNIPLLFTVTSDQTPALLEPSQSKWYPSYLQTDYDNEQVEFREYKWIAWEDVAVSVQSWSNRGDKPLCLSLRTDSRIAERQAGSEHSGIWRNEEHGFDVATVIRTNEHRLVDGLVLQPGEKISFTIAAALGLSPEDGAAMLDGRLNVVLALSGEEAWHKHRADYQAWFDRAPRFESNEPLLDQTWLYRWYLMRNTLADPKHGRLQYPLFYEGRSHKMSKTPFAPKGWEFTKMIPLTTPMHLLESRWYPDGAYGDGVMRNMLESQDSDGLYHCLFVDRELHSYANFMGWAAYNYYAVHRNEEMIRDMLPSLKAQIGGESRIMGNGGDRLLIEYKHNRTGKEYQPSYWYFNDFPEDCKDPESWVPLKRVDRSVYHYLNCVGVARLCRLLGDPEAEAYGAIAEQIKADVLSKMWDGESRFFYDLHHIDDRKAMVKNIVGFYPYWAQIADERHADGLNHLFDEALFRTGNPYPSAAADCPVYAPEGGWKGRFFKGRDGCIWNGPMWPYTNSIVLDALALESKRLSHGYDKQFGDDFRAFSMMHYERGDLKRPYLVEHYNSETGEPISDDADYNHSYYIDLLIRHVAGLNIEADRIVLDPVDIGLERFELDNIKAAGKMLRVTYRKGASEGRDGSTDGYRLYVDGRQVLYSDRLERMEYRLDDKESSDYRRKG